MGQGQLIYDVRFAFHSDNCYKYIDMAPQSDEARSVHRLLNSCTFSLKKCTDVVRGINSGDSRDKTGESCTKRSGSLG